MRVIAKSMLVKFWNQPEYADSEGALQSWHDEHWIHTLRHTHASRLVQNGMSVYEVKEILGHTDIKTTLRYAHLEQRQVTSKARDVMNRLNQMSLDNA